MESLYLCGIIERFIKSRVEDFLDVYAYYRIPFKDLRILDVCVFVLYH